MFVQSVSCVELVAAILNRKGAQFIGWQVETSLSLSGGKKCPFYGATKTCRISGILGVDKEREENDVREKQGLPRDYVAGPRQWGQRVTGTPFIVHSLKDSGERKLYVTTTVKSSTLLSYNDCNGLSIDSASIAPWLVTRAPMDVIYADYSLSSIAIVYRKVSKGDKESTAFMVDYSDLRQAINMF